MILKITSVKILDTIRVSYKDISKDVAILVVLEDGRVKDFKILGVCEFEGNPMSSRDPKDNIEREIIKKLGKILNKENIEKYLGNVLKLE